MVVVVMTGLTRPGVNSKFRAGFFVYGKCISTMDEWRRLLYVGNSVHRKSAVARCLEAGRKGVTEGVGFSNS